MDRRCVRRGVAIHLLVLLIGGAAFAVDPVVEWEWDGSVVLPDFDEVYTAPMVVDVDGDESPEVVVLTGRGFCCNGAAVLRALDGRTGAELWTTVEPRAQFHECGTVAAGDLDGDGAPEFVGVDALDRDRLLAVDSRGSFLWRSVPLPAVPPDPKFLFFGGAAAIVDLDADTSPEIVWGPNVVRADGSLFWTPDEGTYGANRAPGEEGGVVSVAADLDGDGIAEVVAGPTAYRLDPATGRGRILWRAEGLPDGYTAVADLELDGTPEVLLVADGFLHALAGADGSVLWSSALPPDIGCRGPLNQHRLGGQPMVADLDGDGAPEIGVTGSEWYTVFSADGSLSWQASICENSGNMASTSFDLDGDGVREVILADEGELLFLSGLDGSRLASLPSSSCTWQEYPVVADVDGDDQAEVVHVRNQHDGRTLNGVQVVGGRDGWAPAPPVWNQHSYHVTNVEAGGGVPVTETPSWLAENVYRAQEQGCRLGIECPAEVELECPADTSPGSTGEPEVLGGCPNPELEHTDDVEPRCGGTEATTRTWTARFGPQEVSCTQQIRTRDRTSPDLVLPADATVECPASTDPGATGRAEATDRCDDDLPAPTWSDTVTAGSCPQERTIARAWTVRDACGNESSGTQTIEVVDTTPPVLEMPADTTVECGEPTDPAGTGRATARDACEGPVPTSWTDEVLPGSCPGNFTIVRTWRAGDACGNMANGVQTILVRDTTPPEIRPGSEDSYCLWPPNHRYVTFSEEDFSPTLSDRCSAPVEWSLAGCASNQPEDGTGDGHTQSDCVVAPDGSGLRARAERAGHDPDGRRYRVEITATDACGNTSEPVGIGSLYVPHDQDPREGGCRSALGPASP